MLSKSIFPTNATIQTKVQPQIVSKLTKFVNPLPSDFNELKPNHFQKIVEAADERKVIMIGESTHGTEEYYKMRSEITKQLIVQKKFNVVSIEADFSDVERVNRYATLNNGKHPEDKDAIQAVSDFNRYPRWMWRNHVFVEFVEWLRKENSSRVLSERVELIGMDLYSMQIAADRLIKFLNQVDKADAMFVEKKYSTILKYKGRDPHDYARDVYRRVVRACEQECLEVLLLLLERSKEYLILGIPREDVYAATQNARLVRSAERYYRETDNVRSWNMRDSYMFETIESSLIEWEQTIGLMNPKLIVWAHNSHLGDSRATSHAQYGEYNVGTLLIEKFGEENAWNIGFSTYNGSVTASYSWGGRTMKYDLNDAEDDTYSSLFHSLSEKMENPNFFVLFDFEHNQYSELVSLLEAPRYERNVGVQYRKDTERPSHYSLTTLPHQWKCIIHLDKTNALRPLDQ